MVTSTSFDIKMVNAIKIACSNLMHFTKGIIWKQEALRSLEYLSMFKIPKAKLTLQQFNQILVKQSNQLQKKFLYEYLFQSSGMLHLLQF